jgi:hypothetical protein
LQLYETYQEEYGIGRNFRKLFNELPESLKLWLANNIAIQHGNSLHPKFGENADTLVKNLYAYFYDFWRNRFTHASVSQVALIEDHITEPEEGDSRWVLPAMGINLPLNKKKPEQKWDLYYRLGLDVATILRIIIRCVVLQRLGIKVELEQISAYLRSLAKVNVTYAFINEVRFNTRTLNLWTRLDERDKEEFRSALTHVGVFSLKNEDATRLTQRYNLNNQLEARLQEMARRYINEVNEINKAIAEFSSLYPPPKENFAEHWQSIKALLEALSQTETYTRILNWPSINDMSMVWAIIQDPCLK